MWGHRLDPWSWKIPHAAELQLLSLRSRAHAPQQEKPPQQEAHAQQLEGNPRSLQLEKSQCAVTKTQRSQK